jgi:hypothetical protein
MVPDRERQMISVSLEPDTLDVLDALEMGILKELVPIMLPIELNMLCMFSTNDSDDRVCPLVMILPNRSVHISRRSKI